MASPVRARRYNLDGVRRRLFASPVQVNEITSQYEEEQARIAQENVEINAQHIDSDSENEDEQQVANVISRGLVRPQVLLVSGDDVRAADLDTLTHWREIYDMPGQPISEIEGVYVEHILQLITTRMAELNAQ